MSDTPSQKPRHALTDTGATASVPLQGRPVEVPSPARPGDDAVAGVTGDGSPDRVVLPSARTSEDGPEASPSGPGADTPVAPDADVPVGPAVDAPAATGPAAGPDGPRPADADVPGTPSAAPDAPAGASSADPVDDAPTTALPVVPRPRDAAGPGAHRPALVPPQQPPGVPGRYTAAPRPPAHPYAASARHPGAAQYPMAARHPMTAQHPAGRMPSGPYAQAPAVERLPEPFRAAPLHPAAGVRGSGGFRLPDFPARTRPVLPAVLGAATAVVLALGVVAGVTGVPDATAAPAPAPVSTP